MPISFNPLKTLIRRFVPSLLALLVGIGLWASPTQAKAATNAGQYVAADGQDLTAVVECLPEALSEPSLERALRESWDDFLEKVFDLKDNYESYKLEEPEVNYLQCLNRQGFVPQVQQ